MSPSILIKICTVIKSFIFVICSLVMQTKNQMLMLYKMRYLSNGHIKYTYNQIRFVILLLNYVNILKNNNNNHIIWM
jgi:hypothetical protein